MITSDSAIIGAGHVLVRVSSAIFLEWMVEISSGFIMYSHISPEI